MGKEVIPVKVYNAYNFLFAFFFPVEIFLDGQQFAIELKA